MCRFDPRPIQSQALDALDLVAGRPERWLLAGPQGLAQRLPQKDQHLRHMHVPGGEVMPTRVLHILVRDAPPLEMGRQVPRMLDQAVIQAGLETNRRRRSGIQLFGQGKDVVGSTHSGARERVCSLFMPRNVQGRP